MPVLLLLATGCITPGSQHVVLGTEQLQKSSRVAKSFADLEYAQASMDAPISFALDEMATYIESNGRRRFVKGFRLPAWKGSYSLSIASFRMGSFADPAILYPDVRLLDENFREIRALPSADYSLRTLRTGDAITATMFINSHDNGEKYVIVSERDIQDGELEKIQQNVTGNMAVTVYSRAGAVMWMIPTGISSPPARMLASPVGKLEIAFEPYRPKKVGEQ